MLAKYIATGVAGSMLLASAVFAAETSTTPTTAAPSSTAASDASYKGDWRASKVVGLSVYNQKNESIGSINDLLMDKNGGIKAAVISVGGFLGMGSRLVAIQFDKIKFSDQPVAYTGVSNTGGTKPPGSTTTTGSAATTPATASKPNPWYPDHAVFDATKDQLKNVPEFKYSTE